MGGLGFCKGVDIGIKEEILKFLRLGNFAINLGNVSVECQFLSIVVPIKLILGVRSSLARCE